MKNRLLTILHESKIIDSVDLFFARFVADISESGEPSVPLAAALTSRATAEGNMCLDLNAWAGKRLAETSAGGGPVVCPPVDAWAAGLKKCAAVGAPGEKTPLILDEAHRLYLYRYWDYEDRLARAVLTRIRPDSDPVDTELFGRCLDRLFPGENGGAVDWQKVAAAAAMTHRFCVVTGGPGTGKTTTIARMMAAVIETGGPSNPKILLAAPTGKAAARIGEAISRAKSAMDCSERVKARIPEKAQTIHRLLGTIPGSPYFRHHAENRLPVDILVIDEASMMDIPLAAKLFDALPDDARVILTGDNGQLASVAPGAMLGDICSGADPRAFSESFQSRIGAAVGQRLDKVCAVAADEGMGDRWVELTRNYRFAEMAAISALSRAIQAGRADEAMAFMRDKSIPGVEWIDLREEDQLGPLLTARAVPAFERLAKAESAAAALALLDRFRLLCAVNQGPFGVHAVNDRVEKLIRPNRRLPRRLWHPGRPVVVTKNDYRQKLFNGEIGVAWPEGGEESGSTHVFFQTEGGLRGLSAARLPSHETAYAMTVHKSQGSEFDHVVLILPDRDSPVLTRELLYTAVTRAKRSVSIWGSPAVFHRAVSRRIERSSGFRDALWGTASVDRSERLP